jgi:hypothetical protein
VRHRFPPAQTTPPDVWFQMDWASYEDGAIGEVFIELDHPRRKNQDEANLYHDIATLISIALQYGAPLEVLAGATGTATVQLGERVEEWPHSLISTILHELLKAQKG